MCFRHTYLFECSTYLNLNAAYSHFSYGWPFRVSSCVMSPKVRLFRNWILLMISVIIRALFSRKMSLPLMWSQFLLSLASTDIDHFKTGVSSRTKTAPRLKNAAHAPPSLGRNVPSFMLILSRGRDIQHVQHVNTFNERRRSQGKGKSSV